MWLEDENRYVIDIFGETEQQKQKKSWRRQKKMFRTKKFINTVFKNIGAAVEKTIEKTIEILKSDETKQALNKTYEVTKKISKKIAKTTKNAVMKIKEDLEISTKNSKEENSMSTQARLICNVDDGILANYVHGDGYLSSTGKILFEHYSDPEKVAKLFHLGDLSYVNESPEKPKGHSFNTPVRGYCVSYTRDRGDKQTVRKYKTYFDLVYDIGHEQFTYWWNKNKWYFVQYDGTNVFLIPLESYFQKPVNTEAEKNG